MVRTNEGGSVLGFVIVGVVLVSLLVGGVYIVRHQISSSETTQPSPATSTPQDKPASSDGQATSPSSNNQSSNSDQPAPSQPAPTPAPSAGKLPETGPAETMGTLLGLGFLSCTWIAYRRSRRPELSL